MKKLTSILLMILFSTLLNAQENYNSLWEQVQKFENDNLPKSALKIVNTIYNKAEKNNNSPQIIKSLLYKSKLSLTLEENAQLKIVNQFKQHINKSSFPTKNVLENILANLYWQYFNQNKWKFYQRTKTPEKVDKNDFRTWDLDTLFAEIHTYYQKSLENGLLLQQTNIDQYKDILHTVKDSKIYRPTLFDFLAHNALQFYKTSETNITKPARQFKIDNSELIEDAKQFSKLNLTTKDDFSLQFNALKIHQELIKFHLKNNNLNTLVTIDLERLLFLNQHGVFKHKQQLLLTTLEKSKKEYYNNEVSGLYAFEIANIYHQQANSNYQDKNIEHRFKNKDALSICNKTIKKFPLSVGAKKCELLKQKITHKTLSLIAEKFTPINKPSRLLITYNNIDQLFFSVYKINRKELNNLNKIHKENKRINFINKLEKITNWSNQLRNEYDYKSHTTEIIVPKLNHGNYLIVAHENSILNTTNLYATTNIQVTNIALIENTNNNIKTYQVVDRNNGKPIENAKLIIQNTQRSYGKTIKKELITDVNGFASYKSDDTYYNVFITASTKNDNATFGNYYLSKYQKPHQNNQKVETKIKPFIFTDRSIYRPGQTVYFKGIFIQKKGDKSKPFINEYVHIILKDVNGQEVKKLDLKLNDYGSVSGEFILPNNGLTGVYTFSIDESKKQKSDFYDNIDFDFTQYDYLCPISVEEYKRPKFKTEFKPITKTYKLNDNITINGFAKAFSGVNITDAKVVYRVHRKVQYPSWWYWRRPGFSSEAQEITHGEGITDASGNFSIKFKAIPDESVSKDSSPIFNYEVTADVTDVNGETRSATTIVKVGYHALTASLQIPNKINKEDDSQKIEITTKNLNGEFVSAKGVVKIYKLRAPKNPLRKRPWNTPDYQDISETEFKALFPHDSYTKEEENVMDWRKDKLVFEKKFDTQKSKEIILNNFKKWNSGKYIVVLNTKDKFNQKVTDKALFTIEEHTNKTVADNQLFFYKTNKLAYKIGETVCLKIGSASKNITIVLETEKNHKIVKTQLIHLNNEIKEIEIPVNKEDNGGFAIKYYFVNYNSYNSGIINIPISNELELISIETNTFRDKLQPGADETWSFTIKNDKNNKVTAEVLASMYDASLDEFKPHNWQFTPITTTTYHSYSSNTNAHQSFGNDNFRIFNRKYINYNYQKQQFNRLNWFGLHFGNNGRIMMRRMAKMGAPVPQKIEIAENEKKVEETILESTESDEIEDVNNIFAMNINGPITKNSQKKTNLDGIQIRKNLQETAFFYPNLKTDKNGNVTFSFTTPEALTKWKLQLLAYTKELQSATKTLTAVTQKELMVTPNAPRFLREGDKITLSSKISNLSDRNLSGIAQLVLTDAITNKEINLFDNSIKNQSFTVDKNGNTNVSWNLSIPDNVQTVQYKVIAKAGDFSDGEQNVLPVLSNRMLVTETLPMWVRSNQSKTFSLDKLKNQTSTTLSHHKLTLEVTSNPAWYAVQALPYLMEYPYECSEQTFARYYANKLASHIANSNPRIQEVFKQWKSSDALLSNLEKNQELKSLIIQETPWLRDAQSETEQKKRIALLFDLNKIKNEQKRSINKLQNMQMTNGGFPWFKGGNYPNRYITQHIASGFGHLKKLGISQFDETTNKMLVNAIQFLDDEIEKQYRDLLKRANQIKSKDGIKKYDKYLKQNHLNYFVIQYLYMRSFYTDISLNNKTKTAVAYYKNQTSKYWNDYNLYAKGQIALIHFRNGNKAISNKILASLKENSITSDELGMYWKSNQPSWYWYQSPIETQALLIEAFSEIENDTKTIDNLKVWLLKNKQTNRWKTTKATTEAVYALLLQGNDWVSITDMVDVKIENKIINPSKLENVKVEAGTGYFKTSWNNNEITKDMCDVTISKKGKGIAWGGLYWQYFEDLDKITSAKTPLQLKKKLFLKVNSDTGKELKEITENNILKVGDLVTVRIELRSDRDIEFVHMKDMRASGVEPIDVLSKYKWQDGLGYYQSTKDATTNFFFDRLPKGVYIFEYDVRVNNAGNFSNGITTIQSMYAPEFTSHSKGTKIIIE